MGQKVNPKAYRIGGIRTWNSKWFASGKDYKDLLREDIMIRKIIMEKLKNSGVSNIEIERSTGNLKVNVYAAKPGLIIGRGGAGIEQLKQELEKKVFNKIYKNKKSRKHKIDIAIQEIKNPHLFAQVILEEMISDIERRIPYRRVLKQAIDKVRKSSGKGVRVVASGRLDGVEISRTEMLNWGNLPLHTLRADIDYARGAAKTIYGLVGVKVWIYKGEIFKESISKKGMGSEELKAKGQEEIKK